MKDLYSKSMKTDKELAKTYFNKSINKTEQQKALESLLLEAINKGILDKNASYKIADLACGGGTLNYHLASFFPNATFVLLDYNEDGLDLAREFNTPFKERMQFIQGDLHTLPFEDNTFDLVFCWGVLLIFDENELLPLVEEVRRVLKQGGLLYASSLNPHNPKSPLINTYYNTYCTQSIIDMCGDLVSSINMIPFSPHIDFERNLAQRGIGTFTLRLSQEENHILALNNGGGGYKQNSYTSKNPCGYTAQLGDCHYYKITALTPKEVLQ
ncbi:class I SAM-dependent methyltransferase [uncultured Helicobacter sp.]|uniref:class I SAM-dependent methyltransferase n=1 Tax=uncultured Helicobacter sp. TaxID=175537 RepID=UPI0026122DFB|nr:class I SAM-dependent methyltransferase [uncultured Helicobacter sp.]